MAGGDRQLAFTTGPVPTSVQVSGPDRVTPKTVNASFDGTSAAGPFLPCLIITGRTGHEVARIPAPQVAAGESAEVSWFPRVGGAVSPSPPAGGGIQFAGSGAVYGPLNSGDSLAIKTRGGTTLEDDGGDTILHNTDVAGGLTQIINETGNIDLKALGSGVSTGLIFLEATGDISLDSQERVILQAGADRDVSLRDAFGAPIVVAGETAGVKRLGFFGAYVPKQVVTGSRGGNAALASLLTSLANYGLIVNNSTP